MALFLAESLLDASLVPAGVTAAALLLLVYPFAVFRKYVRIMVNILDDQAVDREMESDLSRLDGATVEFRATDGHRLEGVMVSRRRRGEDPAGMVVFAHEFGSDRTSCLRYCCGLLDAGYDVFAFDFRGHGGSEAEIGYRPRQWPSDRERADMVGAIAFVDSYLEQQGRPRAIGLFGVSRGAGSAILSAVGIDSVKAIVTDGAYSSDTFLEHLMRRFATVFARIRVVAENHPPTVWRVLRWMLFRECRQRFGCRFPSVRKAIRRLGPTPILLIHGEKDSYVPAAQSRALHDRAVGPRALWVVPGAKHNQAVMVRPEAYAQRIVRFLDEYLACAPSERPLHSARSRGEEVSVSSSSFVPDLSGTRHEPAPASA